MQHLSHLLRKAVAKKKLSSTGYMGIIFHLISEYLDDKISEGYIKNGLLFLRIHNHGKKLILFREKKLVLDRLHTMLGEYGYKILITDIKFI